MLGWFRSLFRKLIPEKTRLTIARWCRSEERITALERRSLVALREIFRQTHPALFPPPESPDPADMRHHEFSLFSQCGEDGILFHLFDKIGTTDRRFVEFGIGPDLECNCSALALLCDWSGLLMDCNSYGVSYAQQHLRKMAPRANCRILNERIEPESFDTVLSREGFTGEFDLLSIDIDGNDYYVWQALTVARPRVVVIEYNATFGPEREVTIPLTPGFNRRKHHPHGWYFGASLALLERLGREKGYILVGTNAAGVNAFFVREDVAEGKLTARTSAEVFESNKGRDKIMSLDKQFESIAHLPLVTPTRETPA